MLTPDRRSGLRLPAALSQRLTRLNADQRQAIFHEGDLVVRAGPGSGKTTTLVGKAAFLLETQIPSRQGLAAITYTRKAARELTDRLQRIGLHPGRRLTSGTVHGWCLNAVLRSYGAAAGVPVPGPGSVIASETSERLLAECLDHTGVRYKLASYEEAEITSIRRLIAAGLPLDGSDARRLSAARLFDQRLEQAGLLDYESIVSRSLTLVREHPKIAEMLAARYRWLVVDEYQDLGPVLHDLVEFLHDKAGVGIVAVGDPDQTVMGFTGADPAFLNALAARDDFQDITLRLNYRCGSAIIAASAALLEPREPVQADPGRADPGVVERINVTGGLDDHGAVVANKIKALIGAGVAAGRVAVLYPARGPLLDAVLYSLEKDGIPHVVEQDRRLPTGPLADFLTGCAVRAVAGPQPGRNPQLAGTVPTLGDLAYEYDQLRADAGLRPLPQRGAGRLLASTLDSPAEAELLSDWLERLAKSLSIEELAHEGPDERDRTALDGLKNAARRYGLTVADLASQDRPAGKVIVTTYHKAKGREWDVVILPGLLEGILPRRAWNGEAREWRDKPAREVAEARRTFYVALTRARNAVVLISGPGWHRRYEFQPWGPSRFLLELDRRMR